MFEVTLADGRTALADADNANISNPNAPAFKVEEAVAMRQARRIRALEALVAEQNESKHLDGLNSDFAKLHEDLAYGDADMLSAAELKAAAGCVLSLMRIQDALNRSPEWDSETMDAVAAQVRAAGLPLLDADDAALSAEELEEKYSPTGGGEHPLFKREDWRTAVNSDDTLLGYWGWVVNQLNQE